MTVQVLSRDFHTFHAFATGTWAHSCPFLGWELTIPTFTVKWKRLRAWKAIAVVWVPGWNKTKRGKTLAALSFLFWWYIYLCIVKTEDCWMHVLLKIECVYLLKIIMNAGIVKSLPKNGHEWAHVPVGMAWKIWKSPWWDLDCHADWAINWPILMPILCLV